jgi:hypothetical protein
MLSDKLCEVRKECVGGEGCVGCTGAVPLVRPQYSASSVQSIDTLIQRYRLALENNKVRPPSYHIIINLYSSLTTATISIINVAHQIPLIIIMVAVYIT